MPGKHRKSSRPAAIVAMVVAPASVAAAAVTATSMPSAVPPDTTVAAPSVDLLALITPANSTAQFFAGTTYYGTNYTTVYGEQQVVPFLAGPQGIKDAIISHQEDTDPTGVTASGWGAGQTGTALSEMTSTEKSNIDLVILDNNTNRAGGGFWTTYGLFAPLLLTSAAPTPSNTGVPTLDVAYEYNINSDAPVDPLNPFALGNGLAAYAYDYGAEQNTELPPEVQAEIAAAQAAQNDPNRPAVQRHAYVVDADGNVDPSKTRNVSGTTTYVTFESDGLPLTRPLRLLPGGDILADAIDPTMTQLVNAGYNDTKGFSGDEAIPKDPTVTRPMQPGSSLTGLGGVPGSVPEGASDGAQTAIQDVTNPTNFVTKPLGEASKLPFVSTLVPSSLTNTAVSTQKVNTTTAGNPNPLLPVLNKAGSTSSVSGSVGGTNAVKNFTDQVKNVVNKVTGGLTGAKPPAKSNDGS
jgi:PE-PPE domain